MKNTAESNDLLNVLCLEDVLKDAELLNEILADAGYRVNMDIATREKEYVDFLKGRDYDIIFSDNSLPGINVFAALKYAVELKPQIPFICVSGTIGDEKAVELLKQGAADYVLKDRLSRLPFAVKLALKEKETQTERKQAEAELKKSELLLVSSIENQKDTIILSIDLNYRYLYFNKVHKHDMKMAYNVDVELGMNILDGITSDDDRLVAKENYDRALRGESHSNIRTYGNIRQAFYESFFNPIRNNKNEIIGATALARNITERMQAETELIKAKEKAEESDRLKSFFLANMSHEIRTPMNGILGFAELLKNQDLTGEKQQDFIRIIEKSGARLLNTINSIVDISKIEAGLMSLDSKEVNINGQIEFIYKFFNPEVESKGLRLLFKNGLPLKEATIKTDIEKIYAILTNLVKNAIKFTNEGSIEFGYTVGPSGSADSPTSPAQIGKAGEPVEPVEPVELEFYVKDTGIGISQQQKEIIFERFRQGSESLTRNYEGSGLGLSISKSYVELLGGKIWVESEEGKGSIFYFTIPYNPVPEEKDTIKKVFFGNDTMAKIQTLKILVVEDDEISDLILTETLQIRNYIILHAKNGIEAIEFCHTNPDIDLVLMDIKMPEMDGYDATRQIRQFNKDVIIIAQTAYAFSGEREKAIEAGCNDYLSKPIDHSLLHELIKKHFNG
jgi:PAS domain S-box-containing protein